MDRTNSFVDCLQSIKSQNKAIHEILSFDSNEVKKRSKFDNKSKTNEFNVNAKDLIKSISDMKLYLLDNRKDYINIYSPLLSLASMMTDRERDEIDEDVEKFITICNDKAIKCLRNEVKRRPKSQLTEHQNNVIDLIVKYLKSVCDIHSQQKAIRIKRAIEKQRLLRLGNIVMNREKENQIKDSFDSNVWKQSLNNSENNKENESFVSNVFKEANDERYDKQLQYNNQSISHNTTNAVHSEPSDPSDSQTYQQLELSKHELQVFEEENKQLFNEMNSMSEEVKDIELKVVEIARLQEIFTDNVLKQEIDLNKLNDLTIASTENIRGGNEQLREAMKKNAGFRVWILFFITTLAFTILFLDWYNQ